MKLVGREQVQRAAGIGARTDNEHVAEGCRRGRHRRRACWDARYLIRTERIVLGSCGRAELKSHGDETQGERGSCGRACCVPPPEAAKQRCHHDLRSSNRFRDAVVGATSAGPLHHRDLHGERRSAGVPRTSATLPRLRGWRYLSSAGRVVRLDYATSTVKRTVASRILTVSPTAAAIPSRVSITRGLRADGHAPK